MIGISYRQDDKVTFTITLPAVGLFDEQIKALREAKATQIKLGNIDAVQSLHAILVLAERGLHAFNTDPGTPAFLRTDT